MFLEIVLTNYFNFFNYGSAVGSLHASLVVRGGDGAEAPLVPVSRSGRVVFHSTCQYFPLVDAHTPALVTRLVWTPYS
jgi:hypothetical protein